MGLGESAYRELSAGGISVTTICPGQYGYGCGRCALPGAKKMIQPEDIACTVRWLLSLGTSVRVMDVLLECAGDVERRASVELAAKCLRTGTGKSSTTLFCRRGHESPD